MSGCLEIIGPRAAQLGSKLVHLRDGHVIFWFKSGGFNTKINGMDHAG